MKKADFGMIGPAVMGENLAINMESKGLVVAVHNYITEQVPIPEKSDINISR